MKVLEYNIVSSIIDTNKMKQVCDFPIKVIVGLTKREEEFICEVLNNELGFDLLHDETKKLNQVIRQYIKDEYARNHPNNTTNIVQTVFKVETAEEISGHMYETDDESIVTTWLDMLNKRKKITQSPTHTKEQPKVILFDGKTITQKEAMEVQEGAFYHGTDARIIKMSQQERKAFTDDINIALSYMWQFFEPYKFRMDDLKDALDYNNDKTLWLKLYDAIIHYGAMKIGNEQYQYGSFYLCNFLDRAVQYAMDSFAFGESGFNAYYMSKASEKIHFDGWNPSEEEITAINRINTFAKEKPEPIIFRFDNLDYRYLQDESGDSINEKNKEIFFTCGGSFRYTKDLNLDLNKAIKITLK